MTEGQRKWHVAIEEGVARTNDEADLCLCAEHSQDHNRWVSSHRDAHDRGKWVCENYSATSGVEPRTSLWFIMRPRGNPAQPIRSAFHKTYETVSGNERQS